MFLTQRVWVASNQPHFDGPVTAVSLFPLFLENTHAIQWTMTERYDEDKLLIMAGGMHSELIAYKILGNWLDGSELTNVITTSGNASSVVADSFIKVSHLTSTRHAHQTTAATLHLLLYAAY